MKTLRAAFVELIGMFIDDGMLALLAMAAIAAITIAVTTIGLPPLWGGILLLVACIAILAASVWRATRH